ncbi:MAG TPA: hypothetical protein ENI81_06800, partial [Phycisphaerales bacterium]|nr:hypothetical protein [Phycisphaerales bacterium]
GYTSSQLETIESGTTLTITPHIVESDRVVLDISVEVSDSIPKGRATDLPIVTRRIADNTVTVDNGGTVALAGLTREDSTTTHKRTPGLSNLPLIGPLFNNSDDITTSREIAVFVTAHIMRQNQYDSAASVQPAAPPAQPARKFSMPPSPPADSRYQAPVDSRYQAPVDSRYQAPVDSRYQAPVDSRYQAPVDSRYQAPVDSRFTQPAPGSAPLPRFRNDFQSQLGDALRK